MPQSQVGLFRSFKPTTAADDRSSAALESIMIWIKYLKAVKGHPAGEIVQMDGDAGQTLIDAAVAEQAECRRRSPRRQPS